MESIGYAVAHNPFTSTETWVKLEIEEWEKSGYKTKVLNTRTKLKKEDFGDIDFIIAHHCINAWRIMRTNIPFIVISHAHDIFLDKGSLLRRVVRRNNCLGVGYISRYHKKLYESWNLKKLVHTPVSVDVEYFKRSKPVGNQILTGGRHIPKKGIDLAIRAVPNIHVYGEGPLTDKLKQISKTAVFHGFVTKTELKELYENSWLYLFTGRKLPNGDMDGQPTTIKEAMAMELQVISTPIAGIPEIPFIHLVKPDINSIREKINELKPERNIDGANYIRKNFKPEIFVNNILKYLDEI